MIIEKIDILNYNAGLRRDYQLANDWRLITAKYAAMRKGTKTEFNTIDECIDLANTIVQEVNKRASIKINERNITNKFTRELIEIIKGVLDRNDITKNDFPRSYFSDGLRMFSKDFILEFGEICKYLEGSMFEIGCGAGRAMEILKNDGANIQGIDISKDIIE